MFAVLEKLASDLEVHHLTRVRSCHGKVSNVHVYITKSEEC